ncbi:MAG: hypothetical protein VXW22_10590, partial [Pseudomonadota bacterium]|nr:hypothetical protein [Pseudomonadota bacterium]
MDGKTSTARACFEIADAAGFSRTNRFKACELSAERSAREDADDAVVEHAPSEIMPAIAVAAIAV